MWDRGLSAWPLGSLPYQVGSGRRALSALLGGIVGAGAKAGAGHSAPIEGPQDADGGFAGADDEELLSITGVGSVVPQHLAQVPWKGKQGWRCPEEPPEPRQWWHLGTQVLVAVRIS